MSLLLKSILALLILLVAVVSFQNCGPMASNSRLNFGADYSHLDSSNPNPAPATPVAATPTPPPIPGDAPIGQVPTLASFNDPFPAPVRADDCLTNPAYNVCFTYKDPLTTFGGPLNPLYTRTTSTMAMESKILVYGAKIPTTALVNNHFRMDVAAANVATPNAAGDWKIPYLGDTKASLSQLHAFYFLNRQRNYMIARSGNWYFSNRNAPVRFRVADALNNAYYSFNNDSLNFGETNFGNANNPVGDTALDLSVVAHEAGHGNFAEANNNQFGGNKQQCANGTCSCINANGCLGAIHEAVGDLHAIFLFPDKGGSIGNYFRNSAAGLRNAEAASAQTAAAIFTASNGQIHRLGVAYASLWFEVWKKAKAAGLEPDIERIFTAHLGMIGAQDDFVTAFNPISTLAQNLFPGARGTAIIADFRAQYTRLGLTLP